MCRFTFVLHIRRKKSGLQTCDVFSFVCQKNVFQVDGHELMSYRFRPSTIRIILPQLSDFQNPKQNKSSVTAIFLQTVRNRDQGKIGHFQNSFAKKIYFKPVSKKSDSTGLQKFHSSTQVGFRKCIL